MDPNPSKDAFLDIQSIAREIRERVNRRFPAQEDTPTIGSTVVGMPAVPGLRGPEAIRHRRWPLSAASTATDAVSRMLESGQLLAGNPPPQPPTLRGKVGAVLVAAVQRMLFWYTPRIREFQWAVARALTEMSEGLGTATNMLREIESTQDELRRDVSQLTAGHLHLQDEMRQALESARTEMRQALESARTEKGDVLNSRLREMERYTHQTRSDVVIQERRLSVLLEEARRRLPGAPDDQGIRALGQTRDSVLDPMYLEFEDIFRGSRSDIKNRLTDYLPRLRDSHIGTDLLPVLDIGCGRGEWIELLSENGIRARGVDSNGAMVAACRDKGLDVDQSDAIEYLRKVPNESQGAVTAFHVIEHLPLPVLVEIVDQSVRVLRPGGLAIFETPNPENLLVSSHHFYFDPTHRNPIPSAFARFLLEARGLCWVEILPLHPFPDSYRIDESGSQIAQFLNHHFYGPQDYAVIGRKV